MEVKPEPSRATGSLGEPGGVAEAALTHANPVTDGDQGLRVTFAARFHRPVLLFRSRDTFSKTL
jgi:hypothetical protein